MAKLRFYYGTMGGAKSLRLLTTAYNFQEKNLNFIVLKPACDTRDGNDVISSRIGLKRPCLALYPQDSIHLIVENYKKLNNNQLNWLLLDEAQFLTEKQVDELANIVDTLNVDVMCFGLRTDFQSKLFEGSKRLMELADEIEEIKSRCSCGRKTSINARINENGIIINGDQVLVGGDDKYKPLCRKCWFDLTKNEKK